MAVAAVIVGLIGAAVSVAGTIYSSQTTSNDMNKAQDEARRLADIQRKDDLAYKASQERLSKLQLKLQNKQFDWQKEESTKDRTERSGIRAYEQKEKSMDNIIGLVNSQSVLRNNLKAMTERGAENIIGRKV